VLENDENVLENDENVLENDENVLENNENSETKVIKHTQKATLHYQYVDKHSYLFVDKMTKDKEI